MAKQVEKHEKSFALKGYSQNALKGPQVMASYVELIFDMMKQENKRTREQELKSSRERPVE